MLKHGSWLAQEEGEEIVENKGFLRLNLPLGFYPHSGRESSYFF
jgi:hypothetical protein